MNPSSADSPRQPDNSSRKQQRSSSPAGLKDSGSKATQKGSNSSKLITSKQGGGGGGGGGGGRSSRGHSPVSTGRERQAGGAPATRGAAAVQAAGAESPTLSRPAAAAADRGGIQTPEDSPPPCR
ncbi:protein SOGA3-like isoform X5 [Lates japonicus]|uniref:Protein SOGA3-like isoform X5 n=1 Tax=Lates japonicus TaxID=270547 RepID=A0AAD3RGR7_LATJO|nr:protein SOGA3-like isoform X5 [Lates japonicus]